MKTPDRRLRAAALIAALAFASCGGSSSGSSQGTGTGPALARASDTGRPSFLSPHSNPILVVGGLVFVTNTPNDTVDVLDAAQQALIAQIHVGIEPVGLALRPDGRELWVSNHVSDSVSVIDTDSTSATYLQVVATVQDFDPQSKATRFDEPVGIAFASDAKAYVTLSSENQVAIVDVAARRVTGHLDVTAQDPRALAVRGDRLYVAPFESGNGTQLSGCTPFTAGQGCTFDALAEVTNVASLGIVMDIVTHPEMPDRDLFVFDTTNDRLVEVVDTLGTLLYGLAIDSQERVFLTQTDARNEANGAAGTAGHGLAEMENRAFLNRVTRVDFTGGAAAAPLFFDLEPLPPAHPAAGQSRATPYAIQVSEDDATLVVSAAHSRKLLTLDAATGALLGEVVTGRGPRGVALESVPGGPPTRAWVLNALDNTVAVVDLGDLQAPTVVGQVTLDDPTHPTIKAGRFVFEDDRASSTRTFTCASCHPDGHTDQILWVLDTPLVDGGQQIMPRTTQPIRGLRGTAPFHWDGVPGDPYGGQNATNVSGNVAPNCDGTNEVTCARVLVDGSLATTMKDVGDPATNDEGLAGHIDGVERDALAAFLLGVPYPPAQRRAYTNELTSDARQGYFDFNLVRFCGDCHRMPTWSSTNTGTANAGMEAPTWRGAYDRWLIFPQGRSNLVDVLSQSILDRGLPEKDIWLRQIGFSFRGWDMMLEGSTGFPGAFARQVTLSAATVNDPQTDDLLDALQLAAGEETIVLQGEGVFVLGNESVSVALEFQGGLYEYVDVGPGALTPPDGPLTRADLNAEAAAGAFVGTFTGRLGSSSDLIDHLQPWLYTGEFQRGGDDFPNVHQEFPTQSAGDTRIVVRGRHIEPGALVLVDGRRVGGSVSCAAGGTLPDCGNDDVFVDLTVLPPPGTHLLQVQNPGGLVSNECLFLVQ